MSNLGVFAAELKDLSSNKRKREEDNETVCLSDNEDAWQRRRTKKTEKFLNGYDRGQLKAALMESHYMSSVLINRRRDIENYIKKYDNSIPDYEEELKAREDELKIANATIEGLEHDITRLNKKMRCYESCLNRALWTWTRYNKAVIKSIDNWKKKTVDETGWKEMTDLINHFNHKLDDLVDYDKIIDDLMKEN